MTWILALFMGKRTWSVMLPKFRQKLCIYYDTLAHACIFQVKLSFTMKLIRIMRSVIYLGQPRNKVKGNRSVGRLGKTNLSFLYRNELGSKKQIITQELYGRRLPGDQVWIRIKTSTLGTTTCNTQVCQEKEVKKVKKKQKHLHQEFLLHSYLHIIHLFFRLLYLCCLWMLLFWYCRCVMWCLSVLCSTLFEECLRLIQ